MESRTTLKQRLAIVFGTLLGVHTVGSIGLTYFLSVGTHPATLGTLVWFLRGAVYAEYGPAYVFMYTIAALLTLVIISLCVVVGCLITATGIWIVTGRWIFNEA